MVRFAEDDTYGGQDTYAGQEAAYGGQQDAYGGQDWAQEGAYDEAAYTQPADEAGGAYGADAAYSQHVADDANDYGGQNTAASDDAVYDPAYAEEDYGDLDLDAGETRFPELEAAAASHLQACERGRAARKRHKATMEARSKTKSATALQARVRGRNERRKDRDFMRTPNAKAASPDPRTPGGGLTGDSLPTLNNAAAPDPRTPGGGLKAETESPPSVRFAAEPQLDDAPSEFRARRPPTPLPQLGAMNYDDEDDDDDDDEIEEDAAIATPRRDDSRAPEVDRDDVDADPSPISVIESPPVRRSVGFSADPPKRARNVAADDEPPRREPRRRARFTEPEAEPRRARFAAADSPPPRRKTRFAAADSPPPRKARFAEEPSPPRRARFASDSPPAARFPGASPPQSTAEDSPPRRARFSESETRFPGASPPGQASPPRRARFAAGQDSPPRRRVRRTRFAETTTESPAPSDDDARSRRVRRAGGTPPAKGRRRARIREPSPDASELHATRQASLAAAALDARKNRGPRDADDAMAFSPPGAETPQSLRDSSDVVRVQFVAGATPSDAQPPLEEPEMPVRHEPKSRLGVLEARLAALEADRGPRRRKKKAAAVEKQETGEEEDEANDGFLLAFLVAGGVDAPRAVRAAGRLRLRGSYASSQAFATIPAATLQQAGLRAHEIRATLRAARLARQALRAAPQRRAAKATMRSKSTTEAEFAEALKPRRAPRVDPNSWAHRRRAQIRSAERRRRLRQTE